MDFDNVLPHIGHQRYQQLVFYCLAIPCSIMSVVAMYNVLFLSATPNHWCKVPILENTNLTTEEKISFSIPWEMRDGMYKRSMCKMYDINYTQLVDTLLSNSTKIYNSTHPQTDCKYGWIYDQSLYTSTLVTEMDVVCSKSWMAPLAMSVFYAGSLPGNMLFGYIGDRFGRKPTLISIIVMDVLVGLISSFSPNYTFYIVCRFILGLGFPSLYRLAFIIAMELMVPKRRARCGMLYCIFFSLAMVALSGVAYFINNWFHLALATSLPFVVLTAYWWFITESPRWYLSHNRLEKADMIVRKIAKFNGKTIPEGYLQNFAKFKAPSTQIEPTDEKPSIFDLLRTPNLRKKFLIINFVWIVIAFDYSGLSLGSTSLGVNDYIAFAISGLVEIPGISIAWFGVQKIGRRLMLCIAMLVAGLSLMSTGIMPVAYIWETFALSNVGKLGISASFSIIYIYASELVPTVLRSVALASCSFTSGIVLILAPQLLDQAKVYGRIFPLMVFGVLSLIGGLLVLLLPETLNTNLPQTVQESEEFGNSSQCISCFSLKKNTQIEEATTSETSL